MKNLLYFGIAALAGLTSCSMQCTEGDGATTSQERKAGAFSALHVEGPFQVFLSRGTGTTLRLEGEQNLLALVTTENKSEVLTIGSKNCISPTQPIKIYLTAGDLTDVALTGSGQITSSDFLSSGPDGSLSLSVTGSGQLTLPLIVKELEAEIDGSGRITVRGSADKQDIDISGSGRYHGFDLKARETEVEISGSGDAEIHSTEALKTDISGSGNVYYKGSPGQLKTDISGSGRLIQQ